MPHLSRRTVIATACLAAAVVGTATGCGSTPASDAPGGTGQQPVTTRQVFFDPQDLATPETRAVLAQPSEVASFVSWLQKQPVAARASAKLVDALRNHPPGDGALVVVARNVGCDSIGKVELRQDGTDLAVATSDVEHHQECLRANHLVAVFEVPKAALPGNATIDGSAPDTDWK
jgi:hypothetical protein